MSTSTVPIFDPQGTLRDIPYEQMKDALAAGGKPAVKFQAPDKSIRYVPADQSQAAGKAGGTALPIEQQDIKHPGFWSSLGVDLKGMAAGVGKMAQAVSQGPQGLAPIVGDTAQQIGENWKSRTAAGNTVPYKAAAAAGEAIGANVTGMEQSANEGDAAGVAGHATAATLPLAVSEGAGRLAPIAANLTRGAREFVAEKAVAPLVKTPLGMSMENAKFGRNPAAAISQEGLVGTKQGLIEQAGKRIGELSDATDQTLQNHPNASAQIDAEPIIDQAIKDAQASAKKVGNKAAVTRLSDLQEALKTEYGPIKGTPFEMNQLKRAIGEAGSQLGAFKSTDPLEASAAGAMGDVYTAIKNAVNAKVPEIVPLNERVSNLLAAKTALTRNALLEANKSILDSHTLYGTAAKVLKNTVASAPVRTGIARAVNVGNIAEVP